MLVGGVSGWLVLIAMAFTLSLPVLAVIVLLVVISKRAGDGNRVPRTRELGRVIAARLIGADIGIVAAVMLAGWSSPSGSLGLGRGVMLAPVAFGLATLAGIVIGELLVRPSAALGPRTATLAPRRAADYLPRNFTVALGITLATTAVVLTFTSLTASPDDLGRAGRALRGICSASHTATHGPYPGVYYSLPLAVGLLLAVGLAGYAIRRAILRPRGSEPEAHVDTLRARSITAVAGGLGVAVSAPLVGIAFTSAIALIGHACPEPWFGGAGWLMVLIGIGALVMMTWSLIVLATSGSAVPAPARDFASA